ncbi:PAS domain S-box protein [Acidisphaera rubrifaciens]|uniref:histidine kinase n=1 Tax=Acidisphaera rubrifaciens HS-AP3 TaxID=1231350 RepID=A0A0D6P5H2_9PROT|nr:PAS domain S-box protein [Acidisphaera rubrifaciens]GAN77020.1 two component hybrid sensor histidine kinase and transcriptional regulator [Acidisphaera rubrifaciens HS-AP3]
MAGGIGFLSGGGALGDLMRTRDWADSPLGPPGAWPPNLKNAVGLLLGAEAQVVMFWGPQFVALYNTAYAPTIGSKHPAALGRPAQEYWSELWDDLHPLLRRVREEGETVSARDRPFVIDRHGYLEDVWFDISYSPVRSETGGVDGILCIVRETTDKVITAKRQAFLVSLADRLALLSEPAAVKAAAAELLGTWLDAGRAGYAELDEDLDRVAVADDWTAGAMPSMAGLHRLSEFGPEVQAAFRAGRTLVIGDATRDAVAAGHRATFAGVSVVAALAVPLVKDGRVVAALFVHDAKPRRWRDGEVQLVQEAAQRTWAAVEQARAEALLRESEAKFQAIANSIDQMIWSTRPDGYHDYYNDRWYEYTGVPHGTTDGEAWNGVFHPDDRERAWSTWRACLDTGAPYHIEYRLRHRTGVYRWVIGRAQCVRDAAGRITRWYGTCTDIHDRKMAEAALQDLNETLEARIAAAIAERQTVEEALRQAQKMEAVGQLTGGVAHDFNNLLQIVVGNLEMLQRNLPPEQPRLRRATEAAMTGARRAATLTQRLLAFSRRQPLEPKPINANTLVSGMAELLARTLGETISLETVQGAGLWRVEADPNQLESAILNLAVNARDAMPDGGRLTIETTNTHLDRAYAADHAEVQPGQYVLISVSDTGIGMDRETVGRVFEPFFTTKEVGRGTGLGLSMVYGFVKQSGGHVKIYSEPGEGTTVKIYLPRLVGEAAESPTGEESHAPEGTRNETVLVVEDDEDVRSYSVEMLRELGYRVLEARDGPAALRLLEREGAAIDLLFSDVVLPGGLNGEQLSRQARRLVPGLRVLFTTGYARNAIVHHGRLDSGVQLITKPFTFRELAARVREVLDDAAGR